MSFNLAVLVGGALSYAIAGPAGVAIAGIAGWLASRGPSDSLLSRSAALKTRATKSEKIAAIKGKLASSSYKVPKSKIKSQAEKAMSGDRAVNRSGDIMPDRSYRLRFPALDRDANDIECKINVGNRYQQRFIMRAGYGDYITEPIRLIGDENTIMIGVSSPDANYLSELTPGSIMLLSTTLSKAIETPSQQYLRMIVYSIHGESIQGSVDGQSNFRLDGRNMISRLIPYDATIIDINCQVATL